MIITIAGTPGSGKTTVAVRLAQRLGYTHYSVGNFRRAKAAQAGLTIYEFNALGEKDDFTDREADEWQVWLAEHEDNFVIDGRLGWYFIPKSVKVLLTADPAVGARRVFADHRHKRGGTEGEFGTVEDLELAHRQRMHSDNLRYQRHYGLRDCYDVRHFDLVIDTTELGADDVVERVLAHLKAVEAKEHA